MRGRGRGGRATVFSPRIGCSHRCIVVLIICADFVLFCFCLVVGNYMIKILSLGAPEDAFFRL